MISTEQPLHNSEINPWFLTGFTDAEGCFNVNIYKGSAKIGWTIQPLFVVVIHKKDIAMLEKIKNAWGVGKIYKHGKNGAQFEVYC